MRPAGSGGVPASAALPLLANARGHCLRRDALPLPARRSERDPCYYSDRLLDEAPEHAGAWMTAVQALGEASALDETTSALAYLAVLAALRLERGVPFHVQLAKTPGRFADEVISAVVV